MIARLLRSDICVPLLFVFITALAGCSFPKTEPPSTPFAEESFAVGQRYFMKRDYSAAVDRFAEYLTFPLSERNEGKGHYWLARSLLMLGRASDAREHFDEALRCPLSSDIAGLTLLGRGDALVASGDQDAAEDDYRRIVERNGPSDPVDVAMVRLSQTLERQGRSAEARKIRDEFDKRFPSSPVASGSSGASSGGIYSVQIGAFRTRRAADQQAATARSRGFDSRVEQHGSRYHVRVGSFATASKARVVEKRLRAAGFSTFIIK